jgi:hypothetical protein
MNFKNGPGHRATEDELERFYYAYFEVLGEGHVVPGDLKTGAVTILREKKRIPGRPELCSIINRFRPNSPRYTYGRSRSRVRGITQFVKEQHLHI